jgi:hypothetical protein
MVLIAPSLGSKCACVRQRAAASSSALPALAPRRSASPWREKGVLVDHG